MASMDNVAVIRQETIQAIGAAIVETTKRTEDFPVKDIPQLIREDVYNAGYDKGYDEGYAEGAETIGVDYKLYGTHILKEKLPDLEELLIYKLGTHYIEQEFTNAKGMFFDDDSETIYQDNIRKIEVNSSQLAIYASKPQTYLVYDNILKKWRYNNRNWSDFDPRSLIIEFEEPTEVPYDFYAFFTEIENNTSAYDFGRQAGYDEFWDRFQNYGNRTSYEYAFAHWNCEYVRPKYKVIPTQASSLGNTFYKNTVLKKVEAQYFDFSNTPFGTYGGLYYTFYGCSNLEEIEDIGIPPLFSYTHSFSECKKLHTIAKITLNENVKFDFAFYLCHALKNLTIEGTIGQNGLNLQWSTKLSEASIISVFRALSATTSGLSITFSKTAVNTAFPSDGEVPNAYWEQLVREHSNWNIFLI